MEDQHLTNIYAVMDYLAPLTVVLIAILMRNITTHEPKGIFCNSWEDMDNIHLARKLPIKAVTALLHILKGRKHGAMFGPKSVSRINRKFLLLILLLSGDVNINPGPKQVKYPCQICKRAVKWNDRAIAFDNCDGWYHVHCMLMSNEIYDSLANMSLEWVCCKCGIPNFSSTLFEDSIRKSPNSYDILSSSDSWECGTGADCNAGNSSETAPKYTSSPKDRGNMSARGSIQNWKGEKTIGMG